MTKINNLVIKLIERPYNLILKRGYLSEVGYSCNIHYRFIDIMPLS